MSGSPQDANVNVDGNQKQKIQFTPTNIMVIVCIFLLLVFIFNSSYMILENNYLLNDKTLSQKIELVFYRSFWWSLFLGSLGGIVMEFWYVKKNYT